MRAEAFSPDLTSGVNNRIEAGASHSFKIEIHDDTIGLERLVQQELVTRGDKVALPGRTQMQVFPFKVAPRK